LRLQKEVQCIHNAWRRSWWWRSGQREGVSRLTKGVSEDGGRDSKRARWEVLSGMMKMKTKEEM
jgi:hypothetical protein